MQPTIIPTNSHINRAARRLSLLALILTIAGCAGPRQPGGEAQPGLLARALGVFGGGGDDADGAGSADGPARQLPDELALGVSWLPADIDLDRVRRLAVEVVLENGGDEMATLRFPTSQRLEIQLRDASGEVLTRWSDDRAFTRSPGHLTINPGERVVYRETISLRELEAGRSYSLEVLFPGYPELRSLQTLQPHD